jgi:hypothetical protein
MPRVHFVKKARKDNPACKKGESYYWWKFRYGGKRYSLSRPRPSQLTQSDYLGQFYALQEQIEDMGRPEDRDGIEERASELDGIAEEFENLGSEQDDKKYNMPDQLQDGDIGQLLESRSESCQEAKDAVEEAASELRSLVSNLEEDASEEEVDEACDEAESHISDISLDTE